MREQAGVRSALPAELRFFRCALIFSFAFTLLHIFSLPLVVSYDGYLYVQLADILGTQRFSAEWDYLRTPLFPLLLKISFAVFGRQAMAVIFLNSMFNFFGASLLGLALKNLGRPLAAGCAVIAIALCPSLVAYSHCLLSETGTFFFMALYVYLLLWNAPARAYKIAALAAALLVGYYYRPTLLYMAPLIALLCAWPLWVEQRSARKFAWRPWLGIAAVAAVPFVGAMPWLGAPGYKARQAQVFYFGAAKQALLDPADPALGPLAGYYADSLRESQYRGHLDAGGLALSREYRVLGHLQTTFGDEGARAFFSMAWKAPRRYAKGVVRSLLLFGGYPSLGSDNDTFCKLAINHPDGATFLQGPPNLQPAIESQFTQKTAPSLASRLLNLLIPIYNLALFFACVLTAAGFIAAVWRRERAMLVLTSLPLAFFLFHALILMSVDRLVLPVYPLLFLNLFVLPSWLNGLRARRENEAPAAALSDAANNSRSRRAFCIFLSALLFLAAAQLYYAANSRAVPGSDEAHYMSGVQAIADGFHTGGLAGGWRGYLDALEFKTQFICVPAAIFLLLTGKLFASCYASLVVCFVAIGLAAYSFFRHIFSSAEAAVAALLLMTMPLVNGLTHRFYVENYMLLFALLLVDILLRHGGRSFRWCALAGCVLGCGLLVKASFALFVFVPCAYLFVEEIRALLAAPNSARALAFLAARTGVLLAVSALIAYPPYAAHWAQIAAHVKLARNAVECAYPELFALIANISCGPHFFVFCLALVGVPALIDSFPNFERREKLAWISLLLLAVVTLLASTSMVVKTTRYTVTWLPAIAALAVLGLSALAKDTRRALKFGAAAVAFSTLLCLHNSFAILPVPNVAYGPLRFFSASFPLNHPEWMDDNHPLERRDFRAPLSAAEQFIAADAAAHFSRPVFVRTTVHSLYLNHDFMNLLAKAQHHAVGYEWWPGVSFTASAAPEYVLEATGHRALYTGTHYIEFCSDCVHVLNQSGINYELAKEILGPSNTALKIYRRK